MKEELLLNDFLKNHNGYIKTSDFLNLNITKFSIKKFLKNNIIKKVSHGLYLDNSLIEDEYYIIQKRYPQAILSYNTALFILNLSNRAPYEIDITIPRDKKIRGNYKTHHVSMSFYDVGIIEITSPYGNPIKIYDPERCICDILKNENSVDLETRNRILDYYFKSEFENIDKLLEYAKIFKIYEKVNTIIEVMMR